MRSTRIASAVTSAPPKTRFSPPKLQHCGNSKRTIDRKTPTRAPNTPGARVVLSGLHSNKIARAEQLAADTALADRVAVHVQRAAEANGGFPVNSTMVSDHRLKEASSYFTRSLDDCRHPRGITANCRKFRF